LHSRGLVESRGRGLHQLTSSCGKDETHISSDQSRQPHETVYRLPPHEVGQEYQFSELSVPEGDGDLLYEDAYQRRLETIVEEVIEREGPVYLDLVVERVARAHGKQKAGRIIQERVVSAIPAECRRAYDGNRLVLFSQAFEPTYDRTLEALTIRLEIASGYPIDRVGQLGAARNPIKEINRRHTRALLQSIQTGAASPADKSKI
jgi:hypothetical protein